LDFSYHSKDKNCKIPDAYERLLLNVIQNETRNFVFENELRFSWKLFSPILESLENKTPQKYSYGSRGFVFFLKNLF
jgi:glucose-6-phosphate 1-dehydrogenase